MATGKEEFHTINYYLYLGRTGARTSKSGNVIVHINGK
jgi:hypothetical protein